MALGREDIAIIARFNKVGCNHDLILASKMGATSQLLLLGENSSVLRTSDQA